MLVSDLLHMPGLGLIPALPLNPNRPVRGVYTTDLPDPGDYLEGGELVLTSTTWYKAPLDAEIFVRALAGAGCAALVAGTARIGELPDPLREACRRHAVALFTVGDDVSFATITESVLAALAGPDGSSPSRDLHRRLLASLATGAGPVGLIGLLTQATGLECALLSATGRPTTSVFDDHIGRAHRAALAAGGFPSVQPLPGGGRSVSFYPVQSPIARRPPAAYLAVHGDRRDWAPGVADAVTEVCALLAMERATKHETRAVEARFLRESLDLIHNGDTTEAQARLRSLGLDVDSPMAGVVVSTHNTGYGSELAGVVLADLAEQIPGCSAPIEDEGTYLMLIPTQDERNLSTRIRAIAERLQPLLGSGWIAIGTGHPAIGTELLRMSMTEAHHAHRIASLASGTIRTAISDDLSSHLLLLASVPEDVRRLYRSRLIDVLERYDSEHNSDLVATLAAFLDDSGSWSRCAAQLHIHVNTLRYRLQRIEQLTGRSLATFHDRVDFSLALSLR